MPAGAAGASGQPRRIDAVFLDWSEARSSTQNQDLDEFAEAVVDSPVELIEAKERLNVDVVGQLLAAASTFSSRFPGHGPLRLTAVVGRDSDAALRWYCASVGIEVVCIPR